VLAGGLSHERDVSLRSGRRAAGALRASGFHVEESDVDGFLLSKMGQSRPSCVLPMLHGETGEDGSIQEVLQLLDLAYVGSHPAACRVAFDKPVAKTTVARVGVQTPEAVCLPHGTFRELGAQVVLAALVDRLGLPMMIKPTKGGSALGASLVRDVGQLPTAMVNAFAYGETVMIERFVVGTEVAVSVIDDGSSCRALPTVAISPDADFYDYTARYTAGSTEFVAPAQFPAEVLAQCSRVALLAHDVLGLRSLSRTDLIVDHSGMVWFLEVNVAPGMTETSIMPLAVATAGLDLGAVLAGLVRDARENHERGRDIRELSTKR
jgi:D-alanine-D-alanine ligase